MSALKKKILLSCTAERKGGGGGGGGGGTDRAVTRAYILLGNKGGALIPSPKAVELESYGS